ncbi:hypothetical protein Dsin_008015 [Dipteronia sinensis]|uniref:RNase H type-1 domain-containing protein n=1 Tax=Dipteronia sinensis TaxID=43782 RepID=A0AAE0B244_9ROSI|nr:hypothetical protein Dsin_008015 [Dipteronia sinensis]
MGFIIRDCFGEVMAVAAMCQNAGYGYSPLVVEIVALLRGMELALDTGLLPAVVESDALKVVNLVKFSCNNLSDVGLVIQDTSSRLRCGRCDRREGSLRRLEERGTSGELELKLNLVPNCATDGTQFYYLQCYE